jgi:hypothetical protein
MTAATTNLYCTVVLRWGVQFQKGPGPNFSHGTQMRHGAPLQAIDAVGIAFSAQAEAPEPKDAHQRRHAYEGKVMARWQQHTRQVSLRYWEA